MGEFIVSESNIEYKLDKSSDDLLLRIFKETFKEGIIVIDNNDNLLYINEVAKKLIGPLLNNENNNKVDLPYSISKERIIHVKVNPKTYRTISINASKFTYKRKKYHLLKLKKIVEKKEINKERPSILESSNSYLNYSYDFKTKKFLHINKNLKTLLMLDDNPTDLRSSIVEKIDYNDQHIFIEKVNEVENSDNDDQTSNFIINYRYNLYGDVYYLLDFIKITKTEGELESIESNALIINNSMKFINTFSDNDQVQTIIGNNLTIGLYKIDLINKKIEVSDSFYKFLGYKNEELNPLFENFKNLIHKDDFNNFLKSNEEYLVNRELFYQRIIRMKHKNGSYKWVESRGSTVARDETGQPSKIIGIFLDKSKEMLDFEQKEYYKKLFDALLNYTNEIIFVTDEKGKIKHLSQYSEKLTGENNKEYLNKHIWETMLMTMPLEKREIIDIEVHKSNIQNLFRKVIIDGRFGPSVTNHLDKVGNEFFLETIFHPLNLDNGFENLIFAVSKDITGLKILQNEIKESEIIYNEMMDNASDAIIVFEPNSENIIYANNVAAKLYGLTKKELMGRSMIEFSIDTALGSEKVNETMSKKGIVTFKTIHRNSKGKKFQVQIIGSYINYKEQNVILSINKFIKFLK